MSGTESVDVVIVGGGVSSLAAAKKLLDAKCAQEEPLKVVILEARDRLGGRIHTVSWNDFAASGQYTKRETALDLGASYVHGVSKRNPLLQVCDEVGDPPFQLRMRCGMPDTVDQISMKLDDEDDIDDSDISFYMGAQGRRVALAESRRLDKLVGVVLTRLHKLTVEGPIDVDESFSPALALCDEDGSGPLKADLWKNISASDRQEVMKLIRIMDESSGATLDSLSLRYWDFGMEDFCGGDALVSHGYSQLVEWLQRQIEVKGAEVRLSAPVDKIELLDEDDLVAAHYKDEQGTSRLVNARYLICSLPLGVLQQKQPDVIFDPALPPRRKAALGRLGFGLLNKVVLKYDKIWWPKGAQWFNVLPPPASAQHTADESSALAKAVSQSCLLIHNYSLVASKQSHTTAMLVAYLGPPLSFDVEKYTDEEVGRALHNVLSKAMSSTGAAADPMEIFVTRWHSDPRARGSYSHLPPGSSPLDMMEASSSLWEEKLGFCGEHTCHNNFASVHGAWMSGVREAERVLDCIGEDEEEDDDESSDDD